MGRNASGLTSVFSPFGTKRKAPRIALINIMDNAEGTERHFLKTLKFAAPDAKITLCRMKCAKSNSRYFKEQDYLLSPRYNDWQEYIGHAHFDLVIVTGIDRGRLSYDEMNRDYREFWNESRSLFRVLQDQSRTGMIKQISLICWSAFAAMKELYGVEKGIREEKFYGLFPHTIETPSHPLAVGLGGKDIIVPQSRYSYMEEKDLHTIIETHDGEVVMNGPGGPAIWTLENRRITCLINHLEYGIDTLSREYERGKKAEGSDFSPPVNYNYWDTQTPLQMAVFSRLSLACASFYKNMIDMAVSEEIRQSIAA